MMCFSSAVERRAVSYVISQENRDSTWGSHDESGEGWFSFVGSGLSHQGMKTRAARYRLAFGDPFL